MRKNEVYFGFIGMYARIFLCMLIMISSATSLFINPKNANAGSLDNSEGISSNTLQSPHILGQSPNQGIDITENSTSNWRAYWNTENGSGGWNTPTLDSTRSLC
jgi:hypothetical protein